MRVRRWVDGYRDAWTPFISDSSSIQKEDVPFIDSPSRLLSLPFISHYPHNFPLFFAVLLSISLMAPCTHRSQTKGNAVGTPSTENESVIPLEGSTAANINSTQGKVLARRVLPGSALHHQPGTSTLNCAARLLIKSHSKPKHLGNAP